MGKSKKIKLAKSSNALPLEEQIQESEHAVSSSRVKDRGASRLDDADEDAAFIGGKMSQNILRQARQQRQEEMMEDAPQETPRRKKAKGGAAGSAPVPNKKAADSDQDSDGDVESDEDEKEDLDAAAFDSDLHLNPRDEDAFRAFMNPSGGKRLTLGEMIAAKIDEKKTEIDTQFTDAQSLQRKELDPEVVDMYEKVGKVMSMYRSGKVPKAFKVIPKFRHWEDLLNITNPDQWSAAAMFKATRIFTSNLKADMAQRFFNQYLLPRVRDDIDEYQRLNFHLYQALRKALFKPGAFFKGFLLPLCEAGDCTLREAIIIGSVLARNSIPILHSCAVMLKIAEMEYSGANSIFLRVFFDKKYALPYRVVDAVVFHFVQFRNDRRELPVLWHQALLTFAQRYKNSISSEQRDALMEILRIHTHHKITVEVRRELENARCRDLEAQEPTDVEME